MKSSSPTKISLGSFFRESRERAGLSLASVAFDIKTMSEERLSAFENHGGSLGLDEVFALTNILNIDPEEVLRRLHPIAVEAFEKPAFEESGAQILVSGFSVR